MEHTSLNRIVFPPWSYAARLGRLHCPSLNAKKSKNCPKAEAKVWSFREKNINFQLNKAKSVRSKQKKCRTEVGQRTVKGPAAIKALSWEVRLRHNPKKYKYINLFFVCKDRILPQEKQTFSAK